MRRCRTRSGGGPTEIGRGVETTWRGPWSFVVALALVGCGDTAEPGLEGSSAATTAATLQGLGFDTVATIGDPQGAPWEALGGVWDVAAAPDGPFAVLDVHTPAIHLFDTNASPLGTIAARGSGPGELLRPSGLAWGAGGHLFVWDPSNSRVSRFAVGSAGPEFVDQIPAYAFGETGFCVLGDRMYISFLHDDQVIHEVGPAGGIGTSFSSAPEVVGIEAISGGAVELALEDLTPSRLLCEADRILEVGYFQPRVRSLDPDGAVLWDREPADFVPVLPISPDDMGVGFQYAEGTGSHMARSVVPWGEGQALIQYELRQPGARPAGADFHALESRLIRTDTGEELDRTRDLPLILAAQGSRAFVVRQNPFPQVLVLERRTDP